MFRRQIAFEGSHNCGLCEKLEKISTFGPRTLQGLVHNRAKLGKPVDSQRLFKIRGLKLDFSKFAFVTIFFRKRIGWIPRAWTRLLAQTSLLLSLLDSPSLLRFGMTSTEACVQQFLFLSFFSFPFLYFIFFMFPPHFFFISSCCLSLPLVAPFSPPFRSPFCFPSVLIVISHASSPLPAIPFSPLL